VAGQPARRTDRLSVRELCDVAYTLQIEALERRVASEQLVAAIALAAGASGVTMPNLDGLRAEFDAYLDAEPKAVDVVDLALRRALRVA
jgi:hypothetical protein